MSASLHATISAWQRDHESGSYTAEFDGWNLRVEWHPEGGKEYEGRRGFTWSAERGGKVTKGPALFEEIELAMADAEAKVAPLPVKP